MNHQGYIDFKRINSSHLSNGGHPTIANVANQLRFLFLATNMEGEVGGIITPGQNTPGTAVLRFATKTEDVVDRIVIPYLEKEGILNEVAVYLDDAQVYPERN